MEPEFELDSELELATGFETPLVLPVADAALSVAEAVWEGEVDSAGCSAAATNGLTLLPPVPDVKSRVNDVSELCCWIEAETSSVSIASPVFDA